MKKVVSAITGLLIFITNCLISAASTAETGSSEITTSELTDYVHGSKTANVFDAADDYGFTYLCINNNYSWDYTLNYTDKCIRWYVKSGYSGFATENNLWSGFQGFELGNKHKTFALDPVGGKTYAVYAKVRNDSANGIIPDFGVAMSNSYDPANVCYSHEYGSTGMELSGSGWQEMKATITLPQNYVTSTTNDEYSKKVYFGMNKNMPAGTAYTVDASTSDSVYVAEEQAYDIDLTANDDTVIVNKTSIGLSAQMVNQLGISGNLSQKFDWYAMNSDKSAFVSGITFNGDAQGANMTATWNSDLPSGEYVIAARSAEYGYVRTIKLIITQNDLEYRTVPVPENLIPDISAESGNKYLQRNREDVEVAFGLTDPQTSGVYEKLYYTGSTNMELTQGGYRGFEGLELNSEGKPLNLTMVPGATYVISAKIKNASTNGVVPHFGAAVNDSWVIGGKVTSNEYADTGMSVGSDWAYFKATVTLPADYDAVSLGAYANTLYMGFPAASLPGTAVYIDVSSKDAMYFAQQSPTSIKLSCNKATALTNGDVIDVKSDVLNQVGTKGSLSQTVKWYLVNENRTKAVSGAHIVPYEGGAKVYIDDASAITGGITAVAVSADYPLTSGTDLLSSQAKTFYVSPSGNDGEPGTPDQPLATLAGAKAKVRSVKAEGAEGPISVVFAAGKYKIDNTVNFDTPDSGTENAQITYRAADGADVTFTGAAEIPLSAAKKVTDTTVLSKLKDSVKDKVSEFDLSAILSMSGETAEATAQRLFGNYEYPGLYLDGREQDLAQWPNGDGNYSTWEEKSDTAIGYTGNEPDSWSAAQNWWIGGYLAWDYQYMRLPAVSLSSADKQINVTTDPANSLYPHEGRSDITHRWKAYNLIEELDVPSEWYIDRDKMKLYYYVPDTDNDSTLEISSLKDPIIAMNGTQYVNFAGINFTKTRGNAVSTTNVRNITVKKCRFTDIGVDAFAMNGTVDAQTDKNYWQRQKLDAAYNCEVSDSVFYNIGGHAVIVDGGNVDTLTAGNNIVKNCIFHRISQKIKNYDAILVKGCGNIITNNNISRTPFQAIRHYGNNHTISYNEIYNVRQESDDSGAIYCGRNTVQRGSVISYNYLHDLKSTQDLTFKHLPAIYWDDGQTGITAEHNIIRNAEIDVYTNGVDNKFNYNTTIDTVQKHWYFKTLTSGNMAASNTNTDQSTFGGYIADTALYYRTYPNLQTIVESNNLCAWGHSQYNSIVGNLSVNGGTNAVGISTRTYGTVNSTEVSSFDGFVDASKQDYRVKNASAYGSLGVPNENFDIESIGVQTDNAIGTPHIGLTSPLQGEEIEGTSVHFMWDDVLGATSYTVTIAKDAAFSDITATAQSNSAYADITIPSPDGTTYYWKVTAHNTSREFTSDWESDVNYFTNGEKVSVAATLNSDGTIDLSLKNNYYTNGKNANIFVAEYNEGGKTVALQMFTKTLPYNTAVTFDQNKPSVQNSNAASVKVLVWDTDNIYPLTLPTVLK